ncbi:30S ribosomal protein S4, partial [Dysosmobacter welbionis]
ALAHLPVIVGGVADQPHDHGGGHVSQLLGAEARQVQNDHAQLCGGRQVDAVDAGAKPLDELHLRQGLHHLAGDGRVAGGQEHLGSLAARDDLLFCGLLLTSRFHLVLQQLHLDPGRLIGCRHTVQFLGCDAAVIFVNDNCSHKFASFKSRLQRPENGNEDHGYDENDHRQPQAGAEEVHELQVARTDDQGVGAAAHRGQER